MSAGFKRSPEIREVKIAVVCVCEEMEYGTIVPEVELVFRERNLRYIADDSADAGSTIPQALLGSVQGRGGNVHYGDIAVTAIEQIVDERRGSAAHIDDLSIRPQTRRIY
jgi:hypothetical protein